MGVTYKKIASVTVGSGGAANMEFTNIPGTYTDLLLKISSRSSQSGDNDYPKIEFNGSAANQTLRYLQGNGSAASSSTDTLIYGASAADTTTASTFGSLEFYVPNYAGSTNKSVSIDSVNEKNASAIVMILAAGLWSQTAAITSITIKPYNAGANFNQYSTATLYGISKS